MTNCGLTIFHHRLDAISMSRRASRSRFNTLAFTANHSSLDLLLVGGIVAVFISTTLFRSPSTSKSSR